MANSVRDWLAGIGLERYAQVFEENDLDLNIVSELTDADVRELGITSMGHRKALLRAIEALEVPSPSADSESDQSALPSPGTKSIAAHAERRQLTVMFCDLVDSTVLSQRLDPEDMREVMGAYQDAVAGAIGRYDGHVAKFLGDGVLAFFGYPQAQEDQSERAIRAGLDAIMAVGHLQLGDSLKLAARVGIATGQVVIGDLVGQTASETGAVAGETPNLAARLQDVASPNQVVIGDTTRRLVRGTFQLEELGQRSLKGFLDPVSVWRVVAEQAAESRFEASHRRTLSDLIGRDHELGLMMERWQWAKSGEGQVVLLAGEAGIGKSRLLQAMTDEISAEPHITLLYQCSPFHTNSALYPVSRQLEWAARFKSEDDNNAKLDKLETLLARADANDVVEVAPLFANLLSLEGDERYGRRQLTPQQQMDRTLRALENQLTSLAEKSPVLFVFEDAHWIDPTSHELISQTIGNIAKANVLMLITHRPEFDAEWAKLPHVTQLNVNRLSRAQSEQLANAAVSGLPADLIARIVARTDGVPLFVEELTQAIRQTGGEIAEGDIPATLQASLMARLDRLGNDVKEVAQIGAVIGRDYSHALMSAVAEREDTLLADALGQLEESGLVFRQGKPPDATYTFKHALVQDAAYDSLLRRDRRTYHLRIAAALKQHDQAVEKSTPELLAYHCQEGGDADGALVYWKNAGDLATQKSAGQEAVNHYRSALAVLPNVGNDDDSLEWEMKLNIQLGNALMLTQGYVPTSTNQAWETARQLALDLGQLDTYVAACAGMAPTMLAKGKYRDTYKLFQSIDVGEISSIDSVTRIHFYTMLGITNFCLGNFPEAWLAYESALRLDNENPCTPEHPIGGGDPAIVIRSYAGTLLCMTGRSEHAKRLTNEAIEIAKLYDHPFSDVWAHLAGARLSLCLGQYEESIATATNLMEKAEHYGFEMRVYNGLIVRGQAKIAINEPAHGLEELRRGLVGWSEIGGLHLSQFYAEVANSTFRAGLLDATREMLKKSERVSRETSELTSVAEIKRLQGWLSVIDGDLSAAEKKFRYALDLASRNGAMLFEFRAAIDAARLYMLLDKPQEAQAVLSPIHAQFTDGFDTPELVDARTILDALA